MKLNKNKRELLCLPTEELLIELLGDIRIEGLYRMRNDKSNSGEPEAQRVSD